MIYLDHNATTNIHPVVQNKMKEVDLVGYPMNPSSVHSCGRKGKSVIEHARKSLSVLLGFEHYFKNFQVTFTSSGTEVNNLILSNFSDGEIFISATEHLSIFMFSQKFSNITIIKVDENGILDFNDLQIKLKGSKGTKKLLSVMLANNETGIIQPIKKIVKIAHEHGVLVHSDCAQALGKMDTNIIDLGVDFISISAHKFGGPLGVGALISKTPINLEPQIIGGGQERNLRSGTENVHAIAGFGEAANIAKKELDLRISHMSKLRDRLESTLIASKHNIEIVGINSDRLPNTSLIINTKKNAEIQLIALDLKGVAVSSGSACSSGKVGSSHVLATMGYSKNKIKSAIRISLGFSTTKKDIDDFLKLYNEINT